ncbi:hypothetical protein [Streptomyces pinistramenti]|uniref:hypothetical protein n=1 Tax=Streptomyces pinistramenti TaxID=2884812 RepID=UPI001D08ECE2|nr:hypothetical protein [Streptomyces pinistramenti]MCB5911351.1 hypothetical protein [Streptomyces pinistramenti]
MMTAAGPDARRLLDRPDAEGKRMHDGTTYTAHGASPTDSHHAPGAGAAPAGGGPALRRTVLRRVLPSVAAAGIGVAGFAGAAYGGQAPAGAKAATTGSVRTAPAAAPQSAGFPTWGTRGLVHAAADVGSPSVGMINTSAAGQDRITADHQVDTGRTVCEGSACSTYMAHLTGPVGGFLGMVAVAIPQDRLPGIPVGAAGRPNSPAPPGRRRSGGPPPDSPPTAAATPGTSCSSRSGTTPRTARTPRTSSAAATAPTTGA